MNKRLAENIVFYFLGFFIISIFLVTAFLVSSHNLEDNIASEFELSVNSGIAKVEGLKQRIELLNSVISKDTGFNSFVYRNSDNNSYVADQKNLNNLYRNMCLISNDISYIFTVFFNTSCYISSGDTSTDFESYFDRFLDISVDGHKIQTASEFKAFLIDSYQKKVNFLRLDSMRYISSNGVTQLVDPIIVLESSPTSPNSPMFITGYVISQDTLLPTLLSNINTNGACIQLRNIKDESIVYDNLPPERFHSDFYVYEGDSYLLDCHIKVMVPKRNLLFEVWSVSMSLLVIIVCGILSCICFAIYYGTKQYRKTKNLIEFLDTNDHDVSKQSDVAEIQKRILKLRDEGESYRTAAQELERVNTSIQFQNIITQGSRSSEDTELLENMVPFASTGYCVVVMRVISGRASGTSMLLFETLDKSPYTGSLSIHSGSNEEIFIIPEVKGAEDIADVIERFMANAGYVILHFGLSSVSYDALELPGLYDQAESAVVSLFAYTNENKLMKYEEQNRNSLVDITNVENLAKLKNLLLRGQYQEIEALFNEFHQKVLAFPDEAEERREDIYYHVKGIFQDVVNTLGITGLTLKPYDRTCTITDLKNLFMLWTKRLCEITADVKKSHNNDLLDNIVSYVEKSYSNPSLSAYEVSCKVSVSEKYLQSFFREQMGTSFSQHLLVLRLTKAKELLEQTDYSNEQIASMVGFGAVNTFYRNFNKFYGVTPKMYKEGLKRIKK